MMVIYHVPHFTLHFEDDRIIPRFDLDGNIDPATGERLGLIANAIVGDGGWARRPSAAI